MDSVKRKKALSENECTEAILKGIIKALKHDKKEFTDRGSEIIINKYTKKAASKLVMGVIGKPMNEINIGMQITEANGSVFIRAKYKTV